jgi:hypothetical protein
MIVYDDVEPTEKIKIYDKGVDKPPYSDTMEEFRLSYRYGDITTPAIPMAEPLAVECSHFVESVRAGQVPRSSGLVGYQVVKILECAQRSLKNAGHVESVAW